MAKNYLKINGKLEALTSIFHGGDEKTGSSPLLRRIDIYVKQDNDYVSIPYIHGNAVRGRLRRIIWSDFISRINFEFSDDIDDDPAYWVKELETKKRTMNTKKAKLYHALFSGGILESTDEKMSGVIDLDFRKLLTDALPPLSLFGSVFGNQMIAGKMDVEMMFPICQERACFIDDNIKDDRKNESVRCFTATEFITRRDDLRASREEDEQARQMKVEREVFIPGTIFDHSFVLRFCSEIEKSCFRYMLELWGENSTIGGNASSGSGKLKLEYDFSKLPDSKVYLDYVEENKEHFSLLFEKIMERI